MTLAYLGLGSNLGERQTNLSEACRRLELHPAVRIVKKSSVYRSEPWGKMDQPDFYNAVIAVEVGLTAQELLDHCQKIETALGRVRREHWGPRKIDIDILLFGSAIEKSPELTVPHPYLKEREFVLRPLAEIAPELEIPQIGPINELMAQFPGDDLVLITRLW